NHNGLIRRFIPDYSGAAEPPVRCGGSRLSGVAGATCPDFRSHPGEL
ncbi:hypothetical protein HMPREF1986_00944, partial [Oribacterium sp. oral taxon 078 str. F0263]